MNQGKTQDIRPPRVRFAPSPTGALHLGSARTALFNWLFARSQGGDFLVRVEDTDRARSTPEAVRVIFDSLEWLGLRGDEPAVFQSERRAEHARRAHELLERGGAYKCFATADELDEMRRAAKAEGRPMRYDRRWRDKPPKTDGSPFAVRVRAPLEGEIVIRDHVQGEVRVRCEELDDMVLLRADGSPTYMLSVVVDDHDMDITHVIRGDDHLTNAFRQTLLYRAFGWEAPEFAHIPLIHGADGAKLSKRHGAVSTLAYRDAGILPEALCNYLLRLGWGKGDMEEFSLDEARAHFTLAGVGRGAARFDARKLSHLNGYWIRRLESADLLERIRPRLEEMLGGAVADLSPVARALPELRTRSEDINALAASALFYLRAPRNADNKAAKILGEVDSARWTSLEKFLGGIADADWHAERLEIEVRDFAERAAVSLGSLAQPLRAAMTGTAVSPPIFGVLEVLGRDEVLRRMGAAFGLESAD
ncbi:MAG: glutamate--tRNA ligase [Alphaproteobacteria bacterium]|nr:glutamate--tRNA ligase [Alphaproteobacteria bacterium]MDA8004559.1 glutamate--tRNA ligase [Alphaproteobacteria bacterium]MDA8005988.1 glutamate--tRNA ligase [Alphaproteobacteria bacterium]MDA8012836.1 glutamate--tRNA ligase [Alphaproteobacteria bacterium]